MLKSPLQMNQITLLSAFPLVHLFFWDLSQSEKKLFEIKPSLGSVPYWRNRLQFLDYVQKTLAQNCLFSRWQSAGSAHKCCCCSGGMWQRQKPDIAPPFYRGKLQLQPQVSDTNRVVICKLSCFSKNPKNHFGTFWENTQIL